jgi:hypothetical protein
MLSILDFSCRHISGCIVACYSWQHMHTAQSPYYGVQKRGTRDLAKLHPLTPLVIFLEPAATARVALAAAEATVPASIMPDSCTAVALAAAAGGPEVLRVSPITCGALLLKSHSPSGREHT